MADAPSRACVLIAKIDADTPRDMASHLRNLAIQIERGELGSRSISGGCSSGHIVQYAENGEPTREQYFRQLDEYLASQRADDEAPEVSS